MTERYTKAIEQLGSDKLDVRIGGIYALERIARDSARDHPTVMEVLTAFIREHSHEQWPVPEPGTDNLPSRTTRPDVQAAVTVIGRRVFNNDRDPIDLTGAVLARANLTGAVLTSANLIGANLAGAKLARAVLIGAVLPGAVLFGANLHDADLAHAELAGARLTGADLIGADLTGAFLLFADLTGAVLAGVNLTDANLHDANLTDAVLAGANLTGATWPGNAPVPEGWKLDTGSGRLIVDGDAETAEAD